MDAVKLMSTLVPAMNTNEAMLAVMEKAGYSEDDGYGSFVVVTLMMVCCDWLKLLKE